MRRMEYTILKRLLILYSGLLIVMSAPVADISQSEENHYSVDTYLGDALTSEELGQMKNLLQTWDEMGHLFEPEEELLACLREKQRGIRSPGFICEDGHNTPDRSDFVHNRRTKRALGEILSNSHSTTMAVVKLTTALSGENQRILEKFDLFHKWLMRNESVEPPIEKIQWTQFDRCWWMCEEEYYLVDYYVNGDEKSPVIKVYVAKSVLSPPDRFFLGGKQNLLHFGLMNIEEFKSFFFVLHPFDWMPYQHRFKTNTYIDAAKEFLMETGNKLLFSPFWKVSIPLLFVGSQLDDYVGDYLRYAGNLPTDDGFDGIESIVIDFNT